MEFGAIKKRKALIVAEGRGLGMRSNMREIEVNGVKAFEIYGDPKPGRLGFMQCDDNPNALMAFILYSDGTGELAISFETQDENGEWIRMNPHELEAEYRDKF